MSNSSKSDATPTYRGYRRQTLYTLSRILGNNNKDFIFQPEGKEDLAIYDKNHELLEVIQVKAHKRNLTLSDFLPDKSDSFFYRVSSELKTHPNIKISIVSFGEFGPEMLQALQGDEREQKTIAKKLAGYEFLSEKEALNLIPQIHPIVVKEDPLQENIYAALSENSITGGDHYAAFDTLMFWLYRCAENKEKITHHHVIEKFTNIGKFINIRHTYHQEWFTTITPIEDRELDEQEYEELSRGFYQGVWTRYDHILADLDIKRHQKMQEIAQKFKENRTVIVHAASGQGKTTLAYRYLHEYIPQMGRFKIELVKDRKHALEIATALTNHAEIIDTPVIVYFDVSAKDKDWTELVKQLSGHQNISVLVTIREEDFKRAIVSDAEIQFSEVELILDRDEAEEIYQSLISKKISLQFLSFAEAWNKFRGEEPLRPLMEFVYLITQGNTLKERLKQQITRIEDEISGGKYPSTMLDLLRSVAVASAFEARLKVKPLVNQLSLPAPIAKRIFELLEKEYLLRLSPDKSLVHGLHPIRSAILTDILTDPTLSSWTENANTCLPFIYEPDIETFLLYAFSRHQEAIEPLLHTLMSYQPERWVAIAGIVRALIWLGISDYVKTNRELIQETFEKSGKGWWSVLDSDISDAIPGSGRALSKTFEDKMSQKEKEKLHAFQARQSDKKQVFSYIKEWLSKREQLPLAPTSDADWSGMAETMFWIGRLDVHLPIVDWVSKDELDKAIDSLSLEILADLVFGLSYGYGTNFSSWLKKNRAKLMSRFRQETDTVILEDDGQILKLHFILSLEMSEEPQINNKSGIQTENRFHDETFQRLSLLRRLLPDREYYASLGYGHKLWSENVPIDDTEKRVSPQNLPSFWLTSINSTFRGVANQPFRPEDWSEYAELLFGLRKSVLQIAQQLEQGLKKYFPKHHPIRLISNVIPQDKWDSGQQLLNKSPMLPRCALDEWGFVDEFASRSLIQEDTTLDSIAQTSKKQALLLSIALQKYKPFLDAFGKYTFALSNFFTQASRVMEALNQLFDYSATQKFVKTYVKQLVELNGIKENARLSTLNLGEAVKVLPQLQKEFRQLVGRFLNMTELENLERQEQIVFNNVWSLWYFFAFHPHRVLQNPQQECSKRLKNVLGEVRRNLRKQFKKLSSDDVHAKIFSEEIFWDEELALWLTIDGKNLVDVYSSVETVVRAIRKAIHKVEDTELRQYAVEFNWPVIVIIPLIRGKILNAEAWRINTLILSIGSAKEELNWWNLVTQPIPQKALTELGLESWGIPRLEIGAKLMQSIATLSILVAHIRDFDRLPDIDEQGKEQLQEYFHYLADYVNPTYQAVKDSVLEMATVCNGFTPAQYETRPDLVTAMQGLVELREFFFDFKDNFTLTHQEMVEWAEQLEKARNIAFVIYSCWVADVLDEEGV